MSADSKQAVGSGDPFLSVQPYQINLEFFSGPMDLFLHLVQRQEVSVEEVEMRVICEQYLEIITSAPVLDLEQASEYLVIAATLLSLKSQSLLPEETFLDDPLALAEGDEGFLEELRRRLQIYELTKKRAERLRDRPFLGINTFTRRSPKDSLDGLEEPAELELIEEDPQGLTSSFLALLKRVGADAGAMTFRLESVSVVNYMMKIVDSINPFKSEAGEAKPRTFLSLAREFLLAEKAKGPRKEDSPRQARERARGVVIGSFVAVLELARRGVVQVSQDGSWKEMRLDLAAEREQVADDKVIDLSEYREKRDGSLDVAQESEPVSEKKEVGRG